jgi:mono/diheme cytochrome c family protein
MRQAAALRLFCLVMAMAASVCRGYASELTPLQRQGRALATRMCASCHAVGQTDQSPHMGAPPFRDSDRRVDIDAFMARLREGLTSGHPDMPTFRFTRQDARAFVAYLRSIQTP